MNRYINIPYTNSEILKDLDPKFLMGWDGMGMHVSYMAWHGKQILKGNQKKLATTPPTSSRYGKRHMISHPEEKAPRLTSPVSLGRIWTGPPLSSFCFHPRLPIFNFLTQNHFLLLFVFLGFCIKYSSGGLLLIILPFAFACPVIQNQVGKFARFGMKSGRILLCGMWILVGLISLQSSSLHLLLP